VEEEQRIKRLYGYGHTTAEVCDMTGVSRGVAEHIKKAVPR
jgi:DNA-binding CsgD family transcriptional regulator